MRRREPIAYLLPRFSVTRPVTVIMILCAILVVGFIANSRIPVALFPAGMEGNSLGVFANYNNGGQMWHASLAEVPLQQHRLITQYEFFYR